MSLEHEGDVVEARQFAFTHDKEETDQEVEIPAFLLNLVSGVRQSKDELDQQIAQHFKDWWTVERLTPSGEKTSVWVYLKLLLWYPQLVAVNEAIELAKTFSDENCHLECVLSQFVDRSE